MQRRLKKYIEGFRKLNRKQEEAESGRKEAKSDSRKR